MSKISSNIRFLRQLKGLSQEQLADDLKVTRSRIGGYEEARNEPPIDLLIRLSEYVHIAIDEVVGVDFRVGVHLGLGGVLDHLLLFEGRIKL